MQIAAVDRLSLRGRPEGSPIMHQTWENLLFLHWPVDPILLRPRVPGELEIDTFDNKAWIAITPFTVPDLRPVGLPHLPGLSSFHEINVRTYVHRDGVPGIWFFSLDASKTLPVLGARILYALRYLRSKIDFVSEGRLLKCSAQRIAGPAAEFEAVWKPGIELRAPSTESLAFFLLERYLLFSADDNGVYGARIYHAPWQLRDAELISFRSTMIQSLGLAEPTDPPLIYAADRQNVEVWPSEPA
jgi:uncharacterized protein YqjF (DUF2071 family)